MKPISISQIAEALKVEVGGTDIITGISTDSRTVKSGECFFAIKGANFDGHDHIEAALERGAICAVAQDDYPCESKVILKVNDTIEALGDLARWYRTQLSAKVIAITGSAGKTTTRQIVHYIASQHFACHQSPRSFNNNIGLPLTILSAEEHHEILITEIGANAPGEIAYLTNIALPDIAVVTNIHPAHLEGFGSIENIVKEKASISLGLGDDGVLLVNGDFQKLLAHCDTLNRKYTTFGTGAGCDITATEMISTGATGGLVIDGIEILVPLAGKANLENVLAAWAVCKQLGISIEDFTKAIETFERVDMRLQIEKAGPITIINDCYNANPASMENAIECLRRIAQDASARTIFICGQMAELGDYSEKMHIKLGQQIASAGIDLLAAVGPYAETTTHAAKEKAKPDFEAHLFKDTGRLCNNLVDIVRADDIILVKGSRSASLEKAVEKLKELFS